MATEAQHARACGLRKRENYHSEAYIHTHGHARIDRPKRGCTEWPASGAETENILLDSVEQRPSED